MERMVQNRMGVQEKGIHTHVYETPKGMIVALAKGKDLHWETFFFFEQFGKEFPFAAMPQLRSYTLFRKKKCGT